MSEVLDGLVLDALGEGEKCSAEIYRWLVSEAAGLRLFSEDYALLDALGRLEASGLVELFARRVFPDLGLALPQDVYRLTPDGFKELWLAETGQGLPVGVPLVLLPRWGN